MKDAEYWINHLQLEPHPEGGRYKRTFESKNNTQTDDKKTRKCATLIYYLLSDTEVSHFHKLQSDEIWIFNAGSSLTIHSIAINGTYCINKLGDNPNNNEKLQVIIPADTWFAAEMTNKIDFCLASCMVAPGFDFNDFELAKKSELTIKHNQHSGIIQRLSLD